MRQRNNKGFTLWELMLASAILIFALTGLLMLFSNCVLLNEANRNLSVAVNHAQYIMEGIRHLSFANIGPQVAGGTWDWNTATLAAAGMTPLDSENVVSTTPDQTANPVSITVTVNWQDRGRARNVALNALFTNF
ncbi:MAG: hypothetical protein PHT31_04735 [Candidatus Omnitrophica bacterium]|nr:hypothetical protein [Candidatus Omnitrophota bacterium]MDD5653452.1 hypothetical protein [Candidatus Omnitrophota bacterium]